VAVIDVWDFCGLAADVVTRAYRRGPALRDAARAADEAHGSIVERTGLRGTLPVDDPDVCIIVAVAIALDQAVTP
jgi:hypothetical protein